MSSPENLSSQGQFQVRALDNVYQTIVQSVQRNTGQTRFYRKNEKEETPVQICSTARKLQEGKLLEKHVLPQKVLH